MNLLHVDHTALFCDSHVHFRISPIQLDWTGGTVKKRGKVAVAAHGGEAGFASDCSRERKSAVGGGNERSVMILKPLQRTLPTCRTYLLTLGMWRKMSHVWLSSILLEPSYTSSTESQGVRLEPSREKHLQLCDVAVFAPFNAYYRDQVDRFEQGGVNTIGKEHFTSLYSPAKERAFTPKNIKAGFAASGLFLFNPDRVLRSMPKPPAEPTEPAIPSADEVRVVSCRQDVDIEVQTPVTPVSAEGFMSLQNLIIQQDAHALDETSKQNLARHLQKCAKAFQKTSAQSVPQEDRIQFLTTINNEAKVRRSTKSLVLGTARL
ncbi:hypothetical protein B0O99DRAFT_600493 [Bisporella sp. PMI_857]|nr:hypothetical protein B0O99DRAFT_600493 [Bisporella sp. PMI_857]